jgi:hypothetical protein
VDDSTRLDSSIIIIIIIIIIIEIAGNVDGSANSNARLLFWDA